MAWEVEFTDEFEVWWNQLVPEQQEEITAAVELLEERGPALGRPYVDTVRGSARPNMKELRLGTLRIFFAFDPRRVALLLIGGDKRDQWREFYDEMIPLADSLYEEHLESLGETDGT